MTYALPSLAQRPEDIEPNLEYLLAQYGAETGERVRFNKEARERFMRFAASPSAAWKGNFRDLSAAVAPDPRIRPVRSDGADRRRRPHGPAAW